MELFMKISHNLSRDILSTTPDNCYLIITDNSGIIIEINDKFIDDFGPASNNDMPCIGNVLHVEIPNQNPHNTVLSFPGNRYHLQKNMRCSDGQYVSIQWLSFPLIINNIKYIITFGVDITDWESVTQQLMTATQQLIMLNNTEQPEIETTAPKLKAM